MLLSQMKKKRMVIGIVVLIVITIVGTINLYMLFAPQFGDRPDQKRIMPLAKSSIYSKGKFFNETETQMILPKSVFKIVKQQFGKNPGRVPEQSLPSVKPVFDMENNPEDISVIWLGHSSILIRANNTIILTDPVFSKRASPVSFAGPKSFKLAVPYTPDELPLPDVILISHDHFDHLDYKTITQYYSKVRLFLVPLGVRDHLERWGIPSQNIVEFDWWQSRNLSDSLQVIATPSRHFSGRKGQDNSTLWCSWVIKSGDQKIFFSGDSGYGKHFKDIGEKYGPFDLTLMECGAYGQYWPFIHMIPEQTAQAQIDLRGKTLLPIHWAKFNLSLHPWKEPIDRLLQSAEDLDIVVVTPLIGEEVRQGSSSAVNRWWSFMN
jgi:L-ascorbate metabolism protein UlaG (beta-lactamase superfamily)